MNEAAKLAAKLEQLEVEEGLKVIEAQTQKSLHFDVIDDVMCIMQSDGSVNFIAHRGKGTITVEVISAEHVLKILKHYRPFEGVLRDQMQ